MEIFEVSDSLSSELATIGCALTLSVDRVAKPTLVGRELHFC